MNQEAKIRSTSVIGKSIYLKGILSIIYYSQKRQRIENCLIVINKSHYLWCSNSPVYKSAFKCLLCIFSLWRQEKSSCCGSSPCSSTSCLINILNSIAAVGQKLGNRHQSLSSNEGPRDGWKDRSSTACPCSCWLFAHVSIWGELSAWALCQRVKW